MVRVHSGLPCLVCPFRRHRLHFRPEGVLQGLEDGPEGCEPDLISAESAILSAVNSGSASNPRLLFRTGDFRALPARAVHSLGDLRRLGDTIAPDSPWPAYRLTYLGNSDRSASMAMSADPTGELVRGQGRGRTLPGWLFAALSGQIGISRHLRNCSDNCRRTSLSCESCDLWKAGVDRPQAVNSNASFFYPAWRKETKFHSPSGVDVSCRRM